MKSLLSIKCQLLIILLLTFLSYSNIFQNTFATDDIGYIFNWDIPKHISNIPKILTTDSVPVDEKGVYRPIKALFLMLSYKIWGFNPIGYHLNAIVIHLINTTLIYLITLRLTKKKPIAFVSALLFGLHPIHTEAITFILASFDTIGLSFYLLSFWLYLKSTNLTHFNPPSPSLRQDFGPRARLRRDFSSDDGSFKYSIGYSLSVFFALVAFLTYEITLSLPFIIIFYDLCFKKNFFKQKKLLSLKIYGPFIIIFLFYIFLRFVILHIGARGGYLGGSFFLTQLVMIKAVISYIILLVFPVNLSLRHEIAPGIFSIVSPSLINLNTLHSLSIFNGDILLSGCFLGFLIVLSVKIYRKIPIITFCIGWFFISLLPVLYILPQSSILAERYAYLASFGFVLLLSVMLNSFQHLLQPRSRNKFGMTVNKFGMTIILTIPVLIALFYGIVTFQRNKDWKDTLTVWTKLASQVPKDPLTNFTLGQIYEEKGENELAIRYFNNSIKFFPNYPEVYNHLAGIYIKQNKLDEAGKQYQKLLGFDPSSASAKQLISELYKIKNNKDNLFVKDNEIWANYQSDRGYFFSYPSFWQLEEKNGFINIQDETSSFHIYLEVDRRSVSESIEDYLVLQSLKYGRLLKEGPGLVPKFDKTYVRVWIEGSTQKLQFFLFKKDKVVQVVVFPADSVLMRQFDSILGSIEMK